jgi:hypothetical protein
MIENIPANDNQYPEQEAEIRLTLKIKQHARGAVTGSVSNFEVNNYEGLLPNAIQLVREYDFQYSTDKMIEVTIDHVLKARA